MGLDPLPIDAVLDPLVDALRTSAAAVLQAPPGSGKTTRVPLALRAAGFAGHAGGRGAVLLLEPRRIAARAAALALARNVGEPVGRSVGYKVRFDERTSAATDILVVTEGILTRRFLNDPLLEGVGCVVLDEFHERSIHTDLALAFVRELLGVRDDLKLVVMSATLDADAVATYLGGAPIITSAGRPFPVTVTHIEKRDVRPLPEQASGAVRTMLANADDDGGDVLVFLPGASDIQRTQQRLLERPLSFGPGGAAVEVVPLYGALSADEQDRALGRSDARRVILATNIAETSLTFPRVTGVIDAGLMKAARHDPATDRTSLDTVRISLASAEQRAGRAGRVRPGRAVRLWTKSEHQTLRPSHPPELLRVDLARVLLDIIAFQPGDIAAFPFLDAPSPAARDAALELLVRLGALDGTRTRLSPRGKQLAALPVHPRVGVLLLDSGDDLAEVAHLAAYLEDERAWPRGEARERGDSDIADIEATLRALPRNVSQELQRTAKQLFDTGRTLPRAQDGSLTRALLHAYPDRVCRRRKPGAPEALMVGGRGIRLAPGSAVHDAELFLALGLAGNAANHAEVRLAHAVTRDQLEAHLGAAITTADEATFDSDRGVLRGFRRTRLYDLVITERDGIAVSAALHEEALVRTFLGDFDRLLRLEGDAAQLRARLLLAARLVPDGAWPAADNAALKALVPEVCAGRKSLHEIDSAAWHNAMGAQLDYAQRRMLDELLPHHITVPSGSAITVDYLPALADGGAPVLAVRLQELFGLDKTPRVARGTLPVVLHLLSPGYKPVQVTTDLASFWRNTYDEVKRELRARYPRHSWPDDPTSAQPTARALRRR